MKYRVKGTDLLHNGEKVPEGSETELSEKEAKGLSNFLEPIKEKPSKDAEGKGKDNRKGGKK